VTAKVVPAENAIFGGGGNVEKGNRDCQEETRRAETVKFQSKGRRRQNPPRHVLRKEKLGREKSQ